MSDDEVREILGAAGVPLGAPSAVTQRPSPATVRASLSRSVGTLEPHELDAVHAWVAGFRHHWPETFRAWIADAAPPPRDVDPNRFVKLRRIAIANLTRVLGSRSGEHVARGLGDEQR